MKTLKKIKWGNIGLAILFLGSSSLLLHDLVCMVLGMSLTWIGFITFSINTLVFMGLFGYFEEEMNI